ncbi:MAG: FAD-binding oxidoreductase [Candidatus Hodarchaeota archaeon]
MDRETCRIYSYDAANLPYLAEQIINRRFEVIVQPVTVRSLKNLIEFAHRYQMAIVPRGNGTSGWGGSIPTRKGICVSLTQMNKLIHLDDFGCIVSIEAGMTWRELLMLLESIGMTLPVYPSSATAATIGGFIASGGFGIGSSKHGNIIDQTVGLEAVLANGKLVRVGKLELGPQPDPLKDEAEAGSEWLSEQLGKSKINPMNLLAGTYGTIGIITRVTLRIIPKLQLIPFACSFDSMTDLANAAQQMTEQIMPYHLRYLDCNHTEKLAALIGFPDEYNKFVLSGAIHGTIYDNEDDLEVIERIVGEANGIWLDSKRANFYWDERLYPLRFKRQGPSLVPAEVLVPIENLAALHADTLASIGKSKIAVEGTVGPDGVASYLVWILDDERKRISYTIGWHRSFDIAGLAPKHKGRPYAVALWNIGLAKEFYGQEGLEKLSELKKKIDPNSMLNPMKVFGGRVSAAWQSQVFGFLAGLGAAYFALSLGPTLLGLSWLEALLATAPISSVPINLLSILTPIGGFLGILVIRLMTLNQALRVGIPMLRFLAKFLGK